MIVCALLHCNKFQVPDLEIRKQKMFAFFFFFNDTAPTEIYTLPLPDALPISRPRLDRGPGADRPRRPAGGPRRSVPGRLVPDAAPGRIVRRGRGPERGSRVSARPGRPAARAVGLRLAAFVSLDPRDAESAALVVSARLLSRVLRHPVLVAARPVAERAARRRAAHDLRGDDHLLSVLRGVPLLSRGGAAPWLRSPPPQGDRPGARAGGGRGGGSRA